MTGDGGSTPNADAEQALARLAELARSVVQAQAGLARQSVDLARATLSGDLDRASAGKAYLDAASRESARYWRAAGQLAVDYANDLIALGNRSSTRVLREATEAGRSGTQPSNGASSGSTQSTFTRTSEDSTSTIEEHGIGGRRVRVNLRGAVGGRAEGTITVANQHPRPRRIELSSGDVFDAAGAVVAAILDVTPSRVTVPSGQERSVGLGVDLGKASFSAGNRYFCTVEVSGGDEATIEVTIDVGA